MPAVAKTLEPCQEPESTICGWTQVRKIKGSKLKAEMNQNYASNIVATDVAGQNQYDWF